MVDEGIKRAIVIAVVVVVVGRVASGAYDWLVGASDEEMLANQQAMAAKLDNEAREQRAAQFAARRADACFKIQQRPECTSPENFSKVRRCLRALRDASCGMQPRINLCAVVEEFETCSDQFADQNENGCNGLRGIANCRRNPAPEDRENLWSITLGDGMWDGEAPY